MKQKLVMLASVLTLALSAAPEVSGQWVQTNGPYGEYVSCLAFNENNLFAGTFGDGVFRSTDNGASWTTANAGLTNGSVHALINMGIYLFAAALDSGVFCSTDDGTSWTPVNNGIINLYVEALAVMGTNLYAGGGATTHQDCALYRSTDSGKSWTNANTGLISDSNSLITVTSFAVSGTTLFAGTYGSGVFRSTDSGMSWTPASQGLTDPNITLDALVAKDSELYAGTGFDDKDICVFRSTNEGTSWAPACAGITGSEPFVNALAITQTGLLAGEDGTGIFLSLDSGTNWTATNTGIWNYNIQALVVNGTNVFAGTYGGGVFRSTDNGATWAAASNGLTRLNVQRLSSDSVNLFAAAVGNNDGGFFRSSDDGASWTWASTGGLSVPPLPERALVSDGTYLFASTGNNGIYRSSNDGQIWAPANNGISITNANPFLLGNMGTLLFALSFDTIFTIFRSSDSGTSWSAIARTDADEPYTTLANMGTALFAVSSGEQSPEFGGANDSVFLSIDSGKSWRPASGGLPANIPIFSLAVMGNSLFVSTGGIFRSMDSGNSWTNVGISDTNVYILAVSGTNLFAGTGDSGVYLSSDNGAHWTVISDDMPHGPIIDLAVSDSNIFAAIDDGGVWHRPLSDFGISSVIEQPVQEHALSIFPNPLTQSTTINFTSPESGAAEITIVNLLGGEVARIYSGELDAGVHSFIWDASAISPGTYWCEIRMNGRSDQIPIVVQR